jgi:UDP:flavonoid glycosyltransferase YjiC (YdhE family)
MTPEEIRDKQILLAPLNWGLGHATRSSSIIKTLLDNNNRVVLASDGDTLLWLKSEFPELKIYSLPELKIRYSGKRGALAGIIRRLPHYVKSIKKDFRAIKPIIENEHIDLIISDNRYGVYHPKIHSILITHQLRIVHPFGKFIHLPFRNYLEKFDEIWVPDFLGRDLSGELSQPMEPLTTPVIFIGPQSRFSKTIQKHADFKYLTIVSGPEPHRTQLNYALIDHLKKVKAPCAMVLGQPEEEKFRINDNLSIWSDLSSMEIEDLIDRSEIVICRSGYSSIMDMFRKEKKTLLIPTPGQPEQVYLAQYHHNKGHFKSILSKQDFHNYVFKGD